MTYQACLEIHKRRKILDDMDYGNVDFIIESTTVVEQLLRIANAIVDGNCNLTPYLLIDAILFLHENRHYLDIQLVKEVLITTRPQRVRLKMDDKARHIVQLCGAL